MCNESLTKHFTESKQLCQQPFIFFILYGEIRQFESAFPGTNCMRNILIFKSILSPVKFIGNHQQLLKTPICKPLLGGHAFMKN